MRLIPSWLDCNINVMREKAVNGLWWFQLSSMNAPTIISRVNLFYQAWLKLSWFFFFSFQGNEDGKGENWGWEAKGNQLLPCFKFRVPLSFFGTSGIKSSDSKMNGSNRMVVRKDLVLALVCIKNSKSMFLKRLTFEMGLLICGSFVMTWSR